MSATESDMLNLLPTAAQALEKVALAEAEKASAEDKRRRKAEAEKKALIERLAKPSGVSDAEALRRVTVIIQRAVNNGRMEVDVYRFPNTLCSDGGRAINQMESGWENTLTGIPREMYEFWKRHLQARGYRFICQVVDFPGGMPGDLGITLKWG